MFRDHAPNLVSWRRGFPVIMYDWSALPEWATGFIHGISFMTGACSETVFELLAICLATGLIEWDGMADYDGSSISGVAGHLEGIEGEASVVRLSDLDSVRAARKTGVQEAFWRIRLFFSRNPDLFPSGSGGLPYGIFRMDSLFSLVGLGDMDLDGYLSYLENNLRMKRYVMGRSFLSSHRSSPVPVDDIRVRDTFVYEGPYRKLGDARIRIRQTAADIPVYLCFGSGTGEAHMGLGLRIAVGHPMASAFNVGVDFIPGPYGGLCPRIVQIQRSVMNLGASLEYRPGPLSHSELPSSNAMTAVQREISRQLLGGGDVFFSLIMALAAFFRDRGCSHIMGISGSDSRWLTCHDCRSEALWDNYGKRFRILGMKAVGGLSRASLNGGYFPMLRRAMSHDGIGPDNRPCARVTDVGLARMVEAMYEMTPHFSAESGSGKDLVDHVFLMEEVRYRESCMDA